ncbi:MAG: transposase [Desulfurococcales archaeon]|nr:transposase [Desulfurococcales archaeon]
MSRGRRRGGRDPYTCPNCGTKVKEPERTWTLVSPMPDRLGRITMTIMAAFRCPSCGKRWNAAIQKMKVGGEESGEKGKREKREGQVIEIDLSELDDVEPL